MERETGYYWVKDGDNWIVAKYNLRLKNWGVVGNECDFEDADFEEINEDRIIQPKFNPHFKSKGVWMFERSSGYGGYRCKTCSTWAYENTERKCECDKL